MHRTSITSPSLTLTLSVLTFAVLGLLSTSYVYAQNVPQFGNIPANIPKPPPPGSAQESKPNATMQADQNAKDNYARGIMDQINGIMAQQHNNSTRNFIGLLHQFNAQGKIDCPHPGQAPFGQCFLTPKGTQHGQPVLPSAVQTQAQGPSEAQIQHDIQQAQNGPQGQFIKNVKQQLMTALSHGQSMTAALAALTKAGLMTCQPSTTDPTIPVCTITPPGLAKLPPGLQLPPGPIGDLGPLPPGFTRAAPPNGH